MQIPITFDRFGVSVFNCAICAKPMKIGAMGLELLCTHVPIMKRFPDGRTVAEWSSVAAVRVA